MKPKPSVLSLPSGALIKMPAKQAGLKLLTGPTGSGKSAAMAMAVANINDPTLYLPSGITGWHISSADREYRKEVTERLRELIDTKYPDHNVDVIYDLFQRGDYPGTISALRFCERYLLSGGSMRDLPVVGNVLLSSAFDTRRLKAKNIDSVSRVSIALYDSQCHDEAMSAILDLVLKHNARGAEIEKLISERSITDAVTIRGLLKESVRVTAVVNGGVL